MEINPNIILAFAAFVGALAGSAASIFVNSRIAAAERLEQRRKERSEFILHTIQAIVILFTQFEEAMQGGESAARGRGNTLIAIRGKIISQAIGELLVLDDKLLYKIAMDRLMPAMKRANEDQHWEIDGELRKAVLAAFTDALQRLGELKQSAIGAPYNEPV